ncbi:MAG: peptidylprolyl isomerase [Acidobacteria bacterium]|nr:peptidylprolyl isomerase [Acidobacteriota bacterium]
MRSFLITLMVLFAVNVSGQQAETKEPAKANARPEKEVKKEPFDDADVKTMSEKCVRFETDAGLIEMEMFPEHAPEAVRSFLNIVSIGYLDTTTFSRVVPGFVIQGGDLYSREGDVTYEIGMRARKTLPDEPNRILHERGILSMARGDESNTATTGFFILVGSGQHLDGKFAAFGKVTKGMDVVDAIAKAPVNGEKPEKPVRIKKAEVYSCTQP